LAGRHLPARAGAGGVAAKTLERVRTWGSTTNAVLALREHLINEQVTQVVIEGASGARRHLVHSSSY